MKKPKRTTPEQIKQIKDLSHDGMTPYEIAKKMKINYSVARYHIEKGDKPHPVPGAADVHEDFTRFKKQNEYLMKTNKLLVELIEQMNS